MGLLDVLRIPSRMLATDGKANRALPIEARGEMSIYARSVSPRYKDFNSYLKAYRIPWVHSAVGVIAYNASNVGYRLVELDPDGNEVRAVTSSPLLTLLTRPNPVQSGFDLVERAWIDLELTGNAFLSLERADIAGLPTEMYRLRPDRVTVVPDAQKLVGYYLYTVNGKSVRYEVDEMLHMSYPNPEDDLYGMGMIEAAEQRMDSQMAMAEHERTFWRGGAKITGVLTTDSIVPDNVWNRLKTSIQTFFRGSGYSTLMLESGLKYQSVSDGPAKLGMLDMSKASRDEILAIFGVPPTKVGILENANYKAQASDEFFWTETIDPKLSRLENDLDVLVEMFHPGQNLHIRYDRLNFTDDLPVASVAKLLTDSNSRTINEIRSYQGLDPLPGGDIITIAAAGIALDLSTSTPSVIQLKDASSVEPALSNPASLPSAPPQPALPAPAASAKARTSTNHPATGHRLMKHRAETLKKALRHVPALQTFFAGQEKRVKARVMSKQVRKAGLSLFDDPLEDVKLVDVVTPIHEDGMAAGYDAANSVGVAATFTLANPKLVLLQDQLATQVTRVNQTTKDDIAATVAQGLDQGYSVQQIANGTSDGEYGGIRGVFEQARGYRAELIARTETMHAYNGASLTAYDDSGQVDEVEFMDGDDDPECAAVNGTTAPLDEAQDILDAEHPNGTRVAIPIVKEPSQMESEPESAPSSESDAQPVDAATEFVGDVGSTISITPDATQLITELLGRSLSDQEYTRLFSGTDGVGLSIDVSADGQRIESKTVVPYTPGASIDSFVFAKRNLVKDAEGKVYLENVALTVHDAPKGVGTLLMKRQVDIASSLGIDRMETHAVRISHGGVDTANGYYTWARLGYNGDLPSVAQKAFPEAKDMNDLMIRGGKDWWKENGKSFVGTFDLSEGSISRQILDEYVKGVS